MSHGTRVTEIKNPGTLKGYLRPSGLGHVPLGHRYLCILCTIHLQSQLAWASYLEGFFYALAFGHVWRLLCIG